MGQPVHIEINGDRIWAKIPYQGRPRRSQEHDPSLDPNPPTQISNHHSSHGPTLSA